DYYIDGTYYGELNNDYGPYQLFLTNQLPAGSHTISIQTSSNIIFEHTISIEPYSDTGLQAAVLYPGGEYLDMPEEYMPYVEILKTADHVFRHREDTPADQLTGYDLVVIKVGVGPSYLDPALAGTAVPIITLNPAATDLLGLGSSGTGVSINSGTLQIELTGNFPIDLRPASPNGVDYITFEYPTVYVLDPPDTSFDIAVTTSNVTEVATGSAVATAFDTGMLLADGTQAPARRSALGIDLWSLNEAGLALLDNMISWTMSGSSADYMPPQLDIYASMEMASGDIVFTNFISLDGTMTDESSIAWADIQFSVIGGSASNWSSSYIPVQADSSGYWTLSGIQLDLPLGQYSLMIDFCAEDTYGNNTCFFVSNVNYVQEIRLSTEPVYIYNSVVDLDENPVCQFKVADKDGSSFDNMIPKNIKIFNTQGLCIYEDRFESTQYTWSIGKASSLPAGRYYAVFYNEENNQKIETVPFMLSR
ncbi:MAG TPA: hypothetical protein VKS21_00090, partial [Spirochaetota bacterium]|nr:hypothetical protein [Spirochaetota bacterium]